MIIISKRIYSLIHSLIILAAYCTRLSIIHDVTSATPETYPVGCVLMPGSRGTLPPGEYVTFVPWSTIVMGSHIHVVLRYRSDLSQRGSILPLKCVELLKWPVYIVTQCRVTKCRTGQTFVEHNALISGLASSVYVYRALFYFGASICSCKVCTYPTAQGCFRKGGGRYLLHACKQHQTFSMCYVWVVVVFADWQKLSVHLRTTGDGRFRDPQINMVLDHSKHSGQIFGIIYQITLEDPSRRPLSGST